MLRKLIWLAHRSALHVYRRLPVQGRRTVVRVLSPTFTAGSIALIERDDGAVLLIRQVYRRAWGLPGGLLAKRESPVEAARREVREELALDVEVDERGTVVVDLRPRRFDFVFRARVVDGSEAAAVDPRPASAEIEEARWFPKDALPALQFETRYALQALGSADRVPLVVDSAGHVPGQPEAP